MHKALSHIELDATGSASGPAWSLIAAGDFAPQGRLLPGADPLDAVKRCTGKKLRERIDKAPIAVANLEGPVRTGAGPMRKSGPSLQVDSGAPELLDGIGFNVATLANNHLMDYAEPGLTETLASCGRSGLLFCGAGSNEAAAMAPALLTLPGDTRVALFSFCEREFGVASDRRPGTAWIGSPLALKRVEEHARYGRVVVVFAHGGVEEIPLPPPQRADALRRFIDAGAALVIGHHPHVPQGWEMYGGGMIFYSLGNFLFDYPGGARYPKTEWGLMIDAQFKGGTLAGVELIPIAMREDRSVDLMDDSKRRREALEYLHTLSAILADRERFAEGWQELALHLWHTRYRRWLQRASGATGPRANISDHVSGLLRGVGRRIGAVQETASSLPDLNDPLMLLNLIRNESHRWSIETALALESGEEPDRRTPETEARMRELLRWTEGD